MEAWIALTLLSAVFFASKDILVKKYLKKDKISPDSVLFYEYLLAILIILIFTFNKLDFSKIEGNLFLIISKSLTVGTFTILYFKMLEKYEISVVSPLLNLSPLVLLVLSSIFLNETINLTQLGGIVLIIIATYILEVNFHKHKNKKPHKIHFKELFKKPSSFFIFAALILIVISFAAIIDKSIAKSGINAHTNIFFTATFSVIALFLYYLSKKKLKTTLVEIKKYPIVALIAFIAFFSNIFVVSAIAIPDAKVSLIIPLRRTSTLYAAVFGGILFHEKHLLKKGITTVLMIIGILLITL